MQEGVGMRAGDLRRAKAACERLVLVTGEAFPAERRDLAVILLHCGFVPQVFCPTLNALGVWSEESEDKWDALVRTDEL